MTSYIIEFVDQASSQIDMRSAYNSLLPAHDSVNTHWIYFFHWD